MQYMNWLSNNLKIKKLEDWYEVRYVEFAKYGGASLLAKFKGLLKYEYISIQLLRFCHFRLLSYCYPNHPWEQEHFDSKRFFIKSQNHLWKVIHELFGDESSIEVNFKHPHLLHSESGE